MTLENIIGSKVRMSVDEPWNFRLPSGGKKFTGVVMDICKIPGKSNDDLRTAFLINLDSAFSWDGIEIRQITASPRYQGHMLQDASKAELIVNMAIVKDEYINKQDRIFFIDYIKPFAIGSISVT